jgi:hypothetical protein
VMLWTILKWRFFPLPASQAVIDPTMAA